MTGEQIQILVAMCLYLVVVVVVGFFYMKKANENSEQFFLGGRTLGPWIAAMSAEASDMSGWLLMGLPGVAYFFGLSDAIWTAIGLAVGTYLNWLFVSQRLRRYSHLAGNAITIPEFLSNRFKEKTKVIQAIGALFILVFFAVYAGSCFVTFGKLFGTLFGLNYQIVMIVGAVVVILYTFLGGFLVLFGARMAGGCTTGHVLSGMAQLSIAGFLFAAAVFAGGIPTALLLKRRWS